MIPIVVLTGHAAATNAGPAIALSFVLSGIACAFAGLCYAEMASTVPIAGSALLMSVCCCVFSPFAAGGNHVAWVARWPLAWSSRLGMGTIAPITAIATVTDIMAIGDTSAIIGATGSG